VIFLLSLILISCGGGSGKKIVTKNESEYTEAEKFGGTFHLAQQDDPRTFDPCSMWDVSSHGELSAILYNGLVKFDMDGNIVPDLAEKWEVSTDGKIYTFHLRKGIKFHNGDPLTAKDIEFCYKRFLAEPKAYYKWLLDKVQGSKEYMKQVTDFISKQNPPVSIPDAIGKFSLPGLQVKDDYTMVLILDKPYAPFIKGLAMPEAYISSPRAVKEFGKDYQQHPVGTGPFKLKEWVQNGKVVFEANKDYFDGRPYLDQIIVTMINDETSIYNTYRSGQIEAMAIPDAQFKKIINDPEMKPSIVSRPSLSFTALSFCLERPLIKDLKIRLAINYAIDKEAILKDVLNGEGTLATGPIPIGLPDYKSSEQGYGYDTVKARQLLKEAGYPNGFKMQIWINQVKSSQDVAQAIQAYLKQLGIDAEIIQNEWSTLHKVILAGGDDAYYPYNWSADYADAEDFLYPIFHSRNIPEGGNSGRYRNPAVDKILDQAHEETDPKKVLDLLHQAEKLIMADAPKVYLYYPMNYSMHQTWVHNYQIPAIYNADKMNKIWMSEH
jgi:oligopeptide transport system substrate-binding protein